MTQAAEDLIADHGLVRKLSFVEAYKGWRNEARRYDVRSLLRHALIRLKDTPADPLAAAQAMPAITCLVVKWILQDKMMDVTAGKPEATSAQFDALRQRIWDMQSIVDMNLFGETGAYLTIRRLIRPQLEFQTRIDTGLFRDAGMILALPADHRLQGLCREVMGIDLKAYVGLSLVLMGHAAGGNTCVTNDLVRAMADLYGPADTANYLALVAPGLDGLRQRLRGLPDACRKVASELFETPALSGAPLLRLGEVAHIWHRTLLTRSLERFLHRRLTARGQDYIDAYSQVFENHVVEQTRRTGLPTFDEDEVRRWAPQDSKLVDAALVSPKLTVLIESKAGLYDEDILTCGNREWLSQNTRPIRTAVAQIWTIAGHLENAVEPPAEARDGPLFGLVVTNIDLHMGSVARLIAMYPPGKLEPRDEIQRRGAARLSASRIYIIGIATYDRLTECVVRQGLDLSSEPLRESRRPFGLSHAALGSAACCR